MIVFGDREFLNSVLTFEFYDYTYDTLNQLVEALNPLPSNPQESCDYDPVGNRTNSNQNGASTFNQANQLLEDANFNLPVRQ